MAIRDSSVFSHFRGVDCLVTGGAGFIGSNLVQALLRAGARVTIIDNFSSGSPENVPDHRAVKCIRGDLAEFADLDRVVSDMDYVFHCAAQVGNVKSIRAPVADCRSNIMATVRLIEACRDSGIKKLVYSSSSAIFGEARQLPIGEDHPTDPESYYALSKLSAERYMQLAFDIASLPVVCLRYFNAYGIPMERSEYAGVISIFFERLAVGRSLVVYGDGEQLRDFVYVDDVVMANLSAAMAAEPGSVYNVGRGIPVSINVLVEVIKAVCELKADVKYEAPRKGEVRNSVADIGRITAELNYQPAVDLEQGLEKIWTHYYQSSRT